MPTRYEAVGPVEIPFVMNAKKSKLVQKSFGLKALEEHGIGALRGCYVFCISGAHGSIRPYYVGKARIDFESEAFTADKLVKYNEVLHRVTHGRPIMLFVTPVTTKGKFNKTAVGALEQYLIGLAYQVNDDIQNVHGIPKPTFEIVGVHVPKKGNVGAPLLTFRKAFKI